MSASAGRQECPIGDLDRARSLCVPGRKTRRAGPLALRDCASRNGLASPGVGSTAPEQDYRAAERHPLLRAQYCTASAAGVGQSSSASRNVGAVFRTPTAPRTSALARCAEIRRRCRDRVRHKAAPRPAAGGLPADRQQRPALRARGRAYQRTRRGPARSTPPVRTGPGCLVSGTNRDSSGHQRATDCGSACAHPASAPTAGRAPAASESSPAPPRDPIRLARRAKRRPFAGSGASPAPPESAIAAGRVRERSPAAVSRQRRQSTRRRDRPSGLPPPPSAHNYGDRAGCRDRTSPAIADYPAKVRTSGG